MTRTEKIAFSLTKPLNPSLTIILGLYTVLWGAWVAWPFSHVFSSAALYSVMSALGPEYLWGGIAIVAGLIIMYGAIKPSYRNLQIGAFCGFLHWFAISLAYFLGDVVNTGGITALTFAVYSAIIWINIKINRQLYREHID